MLFRLSTQDPVFFFLDVRAVLAPPEKYYKKNRSFF